VTRTPFLRLQPIKFQSLKDRIILIQLFLVTWLYAFAPVQAAIKNGPISLPELHDPGLSIHTRKRFQVEDIKVKGRSVMQLFNIDKDDRPSWTRLDYFAEKTIHISINSQNFAELEAIIKEEGAEGLCVILLDKRQIWRWVPWNANDDFHKREFYVPIETKCEEITNIFYKKMVSTVKEQFERTMEAGTHQPVSINSVFSDLVANKLEDYITTLEPVNRDSKCQTTFELLQWLKGGEAAGFESGKYRLRGDLQAMLQTIEGGVQTTKDEWSQYILEIRVIGFTDQHEVRPDIPLLARQTGVYWGNVEDPPNVHFSGCAVNDLDGEPVYLNFDGANGVPITTIVNNCQLGAVRAYVAMVYLFNRLSGSNISFSYATGGVHRTASSDANKRKIDIELSVRAARTATDMQAPDIKPSRSSCSTGESRTVHFRPV
jgi:hypothetical protein